MLHPQPGYPFSLALGIEYALSDDGLAVTTTATNVGRGRVPVRGGAHPYLTLGTATVDTCVLRAPGRTVLSLDERGIPTGSEPVDGTEYDFRRAAADRRRRSSTTPSPTSSATRTGSRASSFAIPTSGTALTLWVDESYPYLHAVHRRPAPGRRTGGASRSSR